MIKRIDSIVVRIHPLLYNMIKTIQAEFKRNGKDLTFVDASKVYCKYSRIKPKDEWAFPDF